MNRAGIFHRTGAAVVAVWILGSAQTDRIPQPGEEGFNYPMNTLLPCEPESQGWTLLFDGKSRESFAEHFVQWVSGDTAGTRPLPAGWTVSETQEAITTIPQVPDIRSKFLVRDFDFRLSYKNSGNDGIFYKMLTRGSFAWSTAIEFEVQDRLNNRPVMTAGAVYDLFAPSPPAQEVYRPFVSGNWNFVRIVQKGDSVEHWMNNVKIVGYRLWRERWYEALKNSKFAGGFFGGSGDTNDINPEFAQNTRGCRCQVIDGYLGFQGDHDGIWFLRNLRYTRRSEHIRLGPVQPEGGCGATPVINGKSVQPGFSLRPSEEGWRIQLRSVVAERAELIGVDGNRISLGIEAGGRILWPRREVGRGVFYLRAMDRAGKEWMMGRVFIP